MYVRNWLCERSTNFKKVSLTQLRRNKRKRADKTSGWKCPCVCVTWMWYRQLTVQRWGHNSAMTAVTGTPAALSPPHPPHPELQELLQSVAEPAVVGDANHDACAICNQVDLPLRKYPVMNIQWLRCQQLWHSRYAVVVCRRCPALLDSGWVLYWCVQ